MFKPAFLAALGAAIALTGFTASPALAQLTAEESRAQPSADLPSGEVEETSRGRTSRRSDTRIRQRAPAAPSAEDNLAAAQAIATSTGLTCQATEANLLPLVADGAAVYEAACATGPGYILIASTPPQAFDCVLLAASAQLQTQRAQVDAGDLLAAPTEAPPAQAAETDIRCTIPQNTDVMRVMVEYARQAELPCVPNEGVALAKQLEGDELFEVGCEGVDGYLLQKRAAGGWKTTECIRLVGAALACRFSTPAEQAASLKARFANNEDAAACDVSQARYMGANANGSFFEAKCAAGNGVIVRFDPSYAVQQVYPCEVAQRIGGGCTMTEVPPLPEDAVVVPAG
ncbi:MAG: hypothetical protein KKA16_07060 [Alphaproteobacteria bacterium]|nr:hypothetical protein [Alphaproteobacteria bacterium]MBU2379970.1 hypothetical protein [Alphaproteobacteria bacterium]